MSIQIASDLHLEFSANRLYLVRNPLQPAGKVLVLGGDIVPIHKMKEAKYSDFFSFCADHFEATYWIAGNHEYYGGDIAHYRGAFKEEVRPNVHLVNNHVARHAGMELILSTLWTRVSDRKADRVKWGMNDYHLIKNNSKSLTTDDTNELFEENLAFIHDAMQQPKAGKRMVVTHHVPTLRNYPPEYAGSDLNEAFAVDLDEMIETSDIDYWAFGHHHRNVSPFLIGETSMVSNQLGYTAYEEQKGFDPAFVIGSAVR